MLTTNFQPIYGSWILRMGPWHLINIVLIGFCGWDNCCLLVLRFVKGNLQAYCGTATSFFDRTDTYIALGSRAIKI